MIIDCFPFHQELEMLELRFRILAGIVDRFVTVEADQTFSGHHKERRLLDHVAGIGAALGPADLYYQPITLTADSPWARETETRDKLGDYAAGYFTDQDTVLLSDLDEIPDPVVVAALGSLKTNPIRLFQRNFYFYLNAETPEANWSGTIIMPGDYARQNQWQAVREAVPATISHGGWHFGSCFDEDGVIDKLESFSHVEFDNAITKSHVLDRRSEMKDIHGNGLNVADIDETYPDYIRENQARYRHLIWPPS